MTALAVGSVPLQVADPDDHARQLTGERVYLDTVELLRAQQPEAWRTNLLCEGDDLMLQVFQGLQSNVQEVPTAAGWVEDSQVMQMSYELRHWPLYKIDSSLRTLLALDACWVS